MEKILQKNVTPDTLSSMNADDADKVKRINILFDMMKEAQKKAFDGIVDKNY